MVNSPELVGVPGVTGCLGMAATLLRDEASPVPAAQHRLSEVEQ